MTEHISQIKDPGPWPALVASVCLHTLVLVGTAHLPVRQEQGPSSELKRSITPRPTWKKDRETYPKHTTRRNRLTICQPVSQWVGQSTAPPIIEGERIEEPVQPVANKTKRIRSAMPKMRTSEEEAIKDRTGRVADSIQKLPPVRADAHRKSAVLSTPIDKRGLYDTHQEKQAGTLLELAGWVWDRAPHPRDDTDESGKIVFQITIDEQGEMIAIKTLEKTTSPLVESIYKEALTQLTFSRTKSNTVYAPTFTGKITFVIQIS